MGNWGNVYILTTSGVEYFKLTTSGEDADWAEQSPAVDRWEICCLEDMQLKFKEV
jgi:hypothetical protein